MTEQSIGEQIYSYDETALFFEDKYKVNDYITIHQPTVGEIIKYGVSSYYRMVNKLCATTTDMKLLLWEMGKNWNDVSDFTLFSLLSKGLSKKETSILFGELDFEKYEPIFNEETGEMVLYNQLDNTYIDELIYEKFIGYIRKIHGIVPNRMKVRGKLAVEAVIERDKLKAKDENKSSSSSLKNLVSAMLAYPGFKYKSNELGECKIYEFMDTVVRSQIFISTLAVLIGANSGMVDGTKIDKSRLDWTRDVS